MPDILNCSLSQINLPAILIANGVGACLMASILFSRHRRVRTITYDGKLFFWMCRLCFVQCILETAGFFLDGKTFAAARLLIMTLNVSLYILSVTLAFFWVCYVHYKLFGDREALQRTCVVWAVPGMAVCLLAVLNLFYPVFFEVGPDHVYVRTSLFLVPYLITYGYLTYGAILACRYRKRVDQYLFMPVMGFVFPIYIGSLVQLFCYGLSLIWVTTALGLVFLYINLQNEEMFLDPLTHLYNRNYLLHYLDRISRKSPKRVRTTGIMLDINDFKHINDTYGHVQGDTVLRAVGHILLRAAGEHAVVVRYGGDEFLILLENAGFEQTRRIKTRIHEELQLYNASGDVPYPVSLSAGIAELDNADVLSFFQEMDRNMYAQKRAFYLRKGAQRL